MKNQYGLFLSYTSYVSYISHIETAKKKASLESLARISNALGVTVAHMMNGNQINEPSEYWSDLVRIFEVCTRNEKRIICEIASVVKKSLHENK